MMRVKLPPPLRVPPFLFLFCYTNFFIYLLLIEMATQVDGSSAELSAEMVGHAFVSQFYHILHNSPELVQRFFLDTSTMSRPGPDGMLMTVTAMKVC